MRRTLWIAAAALALSDPAANRWLDATMPRLVLLAGPAWTTLGILAVGRSGWTWKRGNEHGLTGLTFALGALAFWMIPRSVDAVRTSAVADQLMHASMLAAGAALAASWRIMPFVVRGVLGIYAAAMTIALGVIYSSYSALLCGTFDFAQQRLAGNWLLRLSPLVVLLVVITGVSSLHAAARDERRNRAGAPSSGPAPRTTNPSPLEQEAPS
jgi:cytochrome c oxidase assembly factor CtaG